MPPDEKPAPPVPEEKQPEAPKPEETKPKVSPTAATDPAPPEPEAGPSVAKAKDIAAVMRMKSDVLKQKREAEDAIKRANDFVARADATLKQRMDSLAQREADLEKKLEAIKTNPAEAYKVLGWDKDEFFGRILSDGKPTERHLASEAIKRAEAAEKKLDEYLASEKKGRDQAEAYRRQQENARAIEGFAGHLVANPKDFPHLVRMHTKAEIAAQTQEICDWAVKNGHRYSDEEIASFLESRAKDRYTRIREAEKQLGTSEATPDGSAAEAEGPKGLAAGSGPPQTRTANGKAPVKPNGKRAMTEAEKDEWAVSLLKQATAKDAKDRQLPG
jgi:hypothetical protein